MSTVKMFVGIFVIAAGIYVLTKVVPPYYESYEFQDAVKDEATRDTYAPKSESEIRNSLFKKAQEYDIPISEDDIKVVKAGTAYNGIVTIRAAYVVHVDLPGYPLDLHFDASTENKGVF